MRSVSRRRAVGLLTTAVAATVGIAVLSSGGWRDADPEAAMPSVRPSGGSASAAAHEKAPDYAGTEVIRQPETSATKGLPGIRPATRRSTATLVSSPLPRTATRRGAVVAGFPVAVIPVMAGSSVSSSGVSSTADILRISVVADSPRSPGSVLTFYRKVLSALGFEESTVPAVAGSIASAFTRGADHLVVTGTRTPGQDTTYSLFGDLHTTNGRAAE